MRIFIAAALGRGNAHIAQSLDGALAPLRTADRKMNTVSLADLIAHGENRIERTHRLLKNHRDIAPAHCAHSPRRKRCEIGAVEEDFTLDPRRLRRQQAKQRQAGHGLAAAAFADKADALAGRDGETHTPCNRQRAASGREGQRQIAHFQQWLNRRCRARTHMAANAGRDGCLICTPHRSAHDWRVWRDPATSVASIARPLEIDAVPHITGPRSTVSRTAIGADVFAMFISLRPGLAPGLCNARPA